MALRTHLLVIDPQNDFMDIAGAALPVAGARPDMARLAALIVIAGEASSHCVRATAGDLADHLPSGRVDKLVLLADCMSPVPGFEAEARAFLDRLAARGATVCTQADWLRSAGLA
ncbi:hypothetical protein [Xylophilus sp.]|uniref:hypothetical protein n=1 Tax=Xylophilus sp. TaxID=2653893 RepID=UPI0013B7A978|nr:hypothetical protein [Xylophilus sp.]KAF1047415.1 MAG: hypothetical protein GAK38_01934 [Xylophilus sp.]